ncbi:PRC-barrel domain-containing protein [Humitalea sp. 24SJ18S-53]|uniref:PRC-barrel domain-containing protein n=1 Tax=Humitalea sp. 24SJ18S-53 TaxID=3422307 RepID=UPI003D672427
MVHPGFTRNVLLGLLTAAVLSLPLVAFGQTPAPVVPAEVVPATPAPPDQPVPAAPIPDATGITPQGMMGVTPAQPDVPATPNPPAAPAPGQPAAAAPVAAEPGLREVRRASLMIGAAVHGGDDARIGTISDVILPQRGGVPVVVLTLGGVLGVGGRIVALPADRLLQSPPDGRWVLPGATAETLAALPTFAFGGPAPRQ